MKNIQVTDDMIGKKFTCIIRGETITEGALQKENGKYYICQNKNSGSSCSDKLGYKYSWCIEQGRDAELHTNGVTELQRKGPQSLPIFN